MPSRRPAVTEDLIDRLSRDVALCWGCVEWGCADCCCDCHDWDGIHAAAKAEIERLRAERDAIDALHQPDPDYYSPRGRQMCLNCDLEWPCPTYELLHPKEARRG